MSTLPNPALAARGATFRPTPDGRAPCAVRGHQVLANTHPLHPRSLASAVFDTSTTRRVRASGATVVDEHGRPVLERVTRWTAVDAVRAEDGRRVVWLTADIYPTPEAP